MSYQRSGRNSRSISNLIGALIIAMLVSSGTVMLGAYYKQSVEKIDASLILEKAAVREEIYDEALKATTINNNTLAIESIRASQASFIIEIEKNGRTKVYDINNPPSYITITAEGRIKVNSSMLKDYSDRMIILLLKEGGKINLTRIADLKQKNDKNNVNLTSIVEDIRQQINNETMVDTFIKSLLTPQQIYDIYLKGSLSSKISYAGSMVIPLKMHLKNEIIEYGIKTTKSGCRKGSKPHYSYAKSVITYYIEHDGKVLVNKSTILKRRAYTGSTGNVAYGIPISKTFQGTILGPDGSVLFNYRGRFIVGGALVVSPPYYSSCGAPLTMASPYTRLSLMVEIVITKPDSNKEILLVLNPSELDLIKGANKGPNLESIRLSPYSSQNGFWLIHSKTGESRVMTVKENTVYQRQGDLILKMNDITIKYIIQLLERKG